MFALHHNNSNNNNDYTGPPLATTLHYLTRNGPHSRKNAPWWFHYRVCKIANHLLMAAFNGQGLTRRAARGMRLHSFAWIADAKDCNKAIAVVLVEAMGYHVYRARGLCVEEAHRGKGYGTRLMQGLERLLPSDALLELCVDTNQPGEQTARLTRFYTKRLGFEHVATDEHELLFRKRVALSSTCFV